VNGVKAGSGIVLVYLVLTLLLTYPLSLDPAGRVLSRVPDTDLFIWTLAWDTHALTHSPFSIFDANIYHPERRTLAYSENLLGDAIFAAPVLWLTNNPVLAMNVVALASCVLCGVGAYLLARKVGVGRPGAILSGLVFAFAPPRFLRIGQLHLTSVQWMPFALAFLHSYFDTARAKDLRLAMGFFTLQALSSGHGAVFTTIAMLGLVLYRVLLGEPIAIVRRVRDVGVAGVLLLAPAILTLLPYFAVQREMGLRRSLDASREWAVPASTFLASPTHFHAFLLSSFSAAEINQDALAWLFPGYLPLLLAAVALVGRGPRTPSTPAADRGLTWTWLAAAIEVVALTSFAVGVLAAIEGPFRWRVGETVILSVRQPLRVWLALAVALILRWGLRRRVPIDIRARVRVCREAWRRRAPSRRRDVRMYYVLLTLLGMWLAIGPPFGLWPAVYWLPGFSFIRVPSRFTLMAMVGLAVLAGLGFDRLTARAAVPRARVLAVVAAVWLLAEFTLVPLATTPFRVEIPAIDRWLDGRPKPFSIAELPLPSFGAGGAWERRQTEYMLHSMAHWQKTVHGYSGFRPPLHQELYWQMRLFPDQQSLTTLGRLGVNYIVVHTDLYPEGEWPRVEQRLQEFGGWLRLEHQEGAGRVYVLTPH
jgi:hypothetical protein